MNRSNAGGWRDNESFSHSRNFQFLQIFSLAHADLHKQLETNIAIIAIENSHRNSGFTH
jgi:hypothetical protein